MHEYSSSDVERMIGLSRGVVRALIRQRFVAPHRGRRREYRFSFQDLIVLRTAKALSSTQLSNRRITRSLRDLRQRLPAQAPLSGLSLRAVGDAVSIREGQSEWESDTGQYLLALDVRYENGSLHIIERTSAAAPLELERLFEQALAVEPSDPQAAMRLYRRCLELDETDVAARINCARLLQEAGEFDSAEQMYRAAPCQQDPHALFNLAVLLEDTGRAEQAIEGYLAVIAADPAFADAHYNLARLYEIQGHDAHMIRHLRQYRALIGGAPARW